MAEIKFGFKAIKPITAWHNEQEITYQPGDEVPAGEWKGAAVEALIENGKIMRYATNVYGPGEVGGDALPSVSSASTLPDDREALIERIAALEVALAAQGIPVPEATDPEEAPFPRSLGGGSFELSDGTHVKGKAKALAAQAELDVAAEVA